MIKLTENVEHIGTFDPNRRIKIITIKRIVFKSLADILSLGYFSIWFIVT